MLRIESQYEWPPQNQWKPGENDFVSVDVRRLHGIVTDMKGYATAACEKMEALLDEGRYDISFQEAKELISYELMMMGIQD